MMEENVDLELLERDFSAGLQYVREFGGLLTKKDQRVLFALEMQAIEGNFEYNDGMEDVTEEAQAKLEEWSKLEGQSEEMCKQAFIAHLKEISPSFDPTLINKRPTSEKILKQRSKEEIDQIKSSGLHKKHAAKLLEHNQKHQKPKPLKKVQSRFFSSMKFPTTRRNKKKALKEKMGKRRGSVEAGDTSVADKVEATLRERKKMEQDKRDRERRRMHNFYSKKSPIELQEEEKKQDDVEEEEEEDDFFFQKTIDDEITEEDKDVYLETMSRQTLTHARNNLDSALEKVSTLKSERDLDRRRQRHKSREITKSMRKKLNHRTTTEVSYDTLPKPQHRKKKSEDTKLHRPSKPSVLAGSSHNKKKSSHKGSEEIKEDLLTDKRGMLFAKVQLFYQLHNKEMLTKGFGHVVDWGMEKGEERLCRKLIKHYGASLPTEEEVKQHKAKTQGKIKSSHSLDEFFSTPVVPKKNKKRQNKLKRARENEQIQGVKKNREFKKRLVMFLLEYEPDRIDQCLSLFSKYKEEKGIEKLNQKLENIYGEGIEIEDLIEEFDDDDLADLRKKLLDDDSSGNRATNARVNRHGEKQNLTERDAKMLALFLTKYDPDFMESGNFLKLHQWAGMNGMASLNRRLKRKFDEDLDEFIFSARKLKKELIEFYGLVDKRKLENGTLEVIFNWTLVNGRAALNENLSERYGLTLESSTKEIQNQTNIKF